MVAHWAARSYNFRTMSGSESFVKNASILPLWLKLIEELAGVQDTHFVCATIATEVAIFSGTTTVVGVNGPQGEQYDVWICRPDGASTQVRWQTDKASFAPIVNSGKSVHLEKLSRPVAELISSELWLLSQDNITAVPLPFPVNDGLPSYSGALCLLDPPANSILGEDELEKLSRGLTVYLDRAALRRQVDQQEVEFAVVSDITHVLTSTLSMERVFQELTGTIRRILQVESLSIGLTEQNTGDIIFIESLMGVPSENLPDIRLRPGQGIAGWVAEHGEPVIVNDAYADNRFDPVPDHRSGFTTRSMICIPLQVEEKTIGVLQAINRRYGQFTTHDLGLLQAIGGPLAAAIENSALHADVLSEKRRVETILTSMFDGLLAISSGGYITRVNDAFLALSMVDDDLLTGKEADKAVSLLGGDITTLLNTILQQDDEPAQITAEMQRSNGETVPVLISGAPIFDNNGQVTEAILTFSDLSQIREVERMRDDLFHAIAHELRTPLTVIQGQVEALLDGVFPLEPEHLAPIHDETILLSRLVADLRELALAEAGQLAIERRPVDMSDLVARVAEEGHMDALALVDTFGVVGTNPPGRD